MESRFVCFECGFESPHRDVLEGHWSVEDHGPANVQKLNVLRARGEAPSMVPTEAEVRQSARQRVNNAVVHRRRLRVIDGGKR